MQSVTLNEALHGRQKLHLALIMPMWLNQFWGQKSEKVRIQPARERFKGQCSLKMQLLLQNPEGNWIYKTYPKYWYLSRYSITSVSVSMFLSTAVFPEVFSHMHSTCLCFSLLSIILQEALSAFSQESGCFLTLGLLFLPSSFLGMLVLPESWNFDLTAFA